MTKASAYARDLSQNQIKVLQGKYTLYITKASRNRGFIPIKKAERLLHITNWETDATSDDVYQFFSDLKAHTRTAFWDFQLLCDSLKPEVLKDIFSWDYPKELSEEIKHESDTKKSQELFGRVPTIENVVRAILSSKEEKEVKLDDDVWKQKELVEQPDAWKYEIARHLITICFEFLQENRYITSKAHERLVEEAIDMVNTESRNIMVPKFWRKSEWL